MLHLFIYDDIKFREIDLPEYCFISSVNMTNNAKEADTSIAPLHREIRYEEFVCFDRKMKKLINKTPELYAKYGGVCFIYTGEGNRLRAVKEHIDWVLKQKYDIDPLGNNGLLDKSSPAAFADKIILKTIFKYKDASLINYRPTKKFLGLTEEELFKLSQNAKPDDIKNNKELFYKRFDL